MHKHHENGVTRGCPDLGSLEKKITWEAPVVIFATGLHHFCKQRSTIFMTVCGWGWQSKGGVSANWGLKNQGSVGDNNGRLCQFVREHCSCVTRYAIDACSNWTCNRFPFRELVCRLLFGRWSLFWRTHPPNPHSSSSFFFSYVAIPIWYTACLTNQSQVLTQVVGKKKSH